MRVQPHPILRQRFYGDVVPESEEPVCFSHDASPDLAAVLHPLTCFFTLASLGSAAGWVEIRNLVRLNLGWER